MFNWETFCVQFSLSSFQISGVPTCRPVGSGENSGEKISTTQTYPQRFWTILELNLNCMRNFNRSAIGTISRK